MAKCIKCGNCAKSGCDYCRQCMDEMGIDYTGKKRKKKMPRQQCEGITKLGLRCKNKATRRGGKFCGLHKNQSTSKPLVISPNGSKPPLEKKQKRTKRNSSFVQPDYIIHNTPHSKRFTWKDREGYRKYTKTKHWTTVKLYMLKKEPRCAFCGTNKELQVHHKTYDHVWEEREYELSVLCKTHHYALHDFDKGLLVSLDNHNPIKSPNEIMEDYYMSGAYIGCDIVQTNGWIGDVKNQKHNTNKLFNEMYKNNERYFYSETYRNMVHEAEDIGDLRFLHYIGRFVRAHIEFRNVDENIETCSVCGNMIYVDEDDDIRVCHKCVSNKILEDYQVA